MTVTKSILEEVELKSGSQMYVQISMGGRVSLSFDGPETSYSINMTRDEAQQYAEAIMKAIGESHE